MTEQELKELEDLKEQLRLSNEEKEKMSKTIETVTGERDKALSEKQSLETDFNKYKTEHADDVLGGKELPQLDPDKMFANMLKEMFKEN